MLCFFDKSYFCYFKISAKIKCTKNIEQLLETKFPGIFLNFLKFAWAYKTCVHCYPLSFLFENSSSKINTLVFHFTSFKFHILRF